MPYQNNSDLPESVKDSLPEKAQDIYRGAYNSAWENYSSPKDRKGDASREETAHRVAWAAVKKKYRKEDGKWTKKK